MNGRSGEEVSLAVRTTSGEQKIDGSDVLLAVGRIPNTAGIGLEEAGVALDSRGYIRVNERLETTAAGVWAIGECAGSPQFTHISVDDFRIIRDNLAGGRRSTRDRLVAYCMFTEPPLARVGLSEGVSRDLLKRNAMASPRAWKCRRARWTCRHRGGSFWHGRNEHGFMKALIGTDDRILGFAIRSVPTPAKSWQPVHNGVLANLPYPRLRAARSCAPDDGPGGLGHLFSD